MRRMEQVCSRLTITCSPCISNAVGSRASHSTSASIPWTPRSSRYNQSMPTVRSASPTRATTAIVERLIVKTGFQNKRMIEKRRHPELARRAEEHDRCSVGSRGAYRPRTSRHSFRPFRPWRRVPRSSRQTRRSAPEPAYTSIIPGHSAPP